MTRPGKSLSCKIGDRIVGDGAACFVIAEIGSNHNQDFEQACKLIEAAAECGVDAVKFQTFRAADHYSRKAPSFKYLKDKNTHQLIQSLELDRSWHKSLQKKAADCGMAFFSSPCDADAVADLSKLGVPAHKVASFDITDDILISAIASCGKPIILSTGMANWGDIERAVDAAKGKGNDNIILLQCTSLYPAPCHLSNLNAMKAMRAAFDVLVGFSDHTEGDHVALAAVALGACMIEKHFTLDRSMPGPDHPFATEPKDLKTLVKKIREIESALGDGQKTGPCSQEKEMAEKGRRSLHAKAHIKAGQIIQREMLVVKRPGLGLPPHFREHVIGRPARRDIEADDWITWDMI